MNTITVAAAQMGEVPTSIVGELDARKINDHFLNGTISQKKASINLIQAIDVDKIRTYNIFRMETLIKKSLIYKPDLIAFPELALTSFFPYLWIESNHILRKFLETDEKWKNKVRLLSDKYKIAISYGYCGLVGNKSKNIYELITPHSPTSSYIYEKVHIPGHEKPTQGESTFQFEKKYFYPGDQYPVWHIPLKKHVSVQVGMIICHDRRYNGPYLIMGLRGVQLIINGFNTPFNFMSQDKLDAHVYEFHYLPLQSQAISEGTFIVSVARSGIVFGHKQIAGSCIISPYGKFLAKTENIGEDLIVAKLDLGECDEVKAQKYHGERSQPAVLKKEIDRYLKDSKAISLNHILSELDSY